MKIYKEYLIGEAHTDEYDVFLLCLHHESILNYIEKIKAEPLIQNQSGKLLIDQLLVTGNGNNRFLLFDFNHGILHLDHATNVEPDESYRDRAVELLSQNREFLKNSILSNQERAAIRKGLQI